MEALPRRFGVSGSAGLTSPDGHFGSLRIIVRPPQSQTPSPPGLVRENPGLISPPALTTPVIRIPWVRSPGS